MQSTYSRLNRVCSAGKPQAGHCSTFGSFPPSCGPLFISPDTVGQTVCGIRYLYSSLLETIGLSVSRSRIRVIAAVIGVVLWAASLAALGLLRNLRAGSRKRAVCNDVETNANEASETEYLESQYFSLKIVLVALAYAVAAILLWTSRPVYIPSPGVIWCRLPCCTG